MKKIVILTESSEQPDTLIKCLSVLFPECEIQVRSRHAANSEEVGFDFPQGNAVTLKKTVNKADF